MNTPTAPPEHEPKLRRLVEVFLDENSKVNLSAFRTPESCWEGNVLDSLAFLPVAERLGLTSGRAIDIGTGGGFPLLPLALCLPAFGFSGLDSTAKKVEAVRRISESMVIPNIDQLIPERAEEAGRRYEERAAYDIAFARAIGPLAMLLEYCAPFVKVGGHLVIWKSLHIDEELAAAANAESVLGCERIEPYLYELGDFGERQLILYRKARATSATYPRPVGQAKKNPL